MTLLTLPGIANDAKTENAIPVVILEPTIVEPPVTVRDIIEVDVEEGIALALISISYNL